jgi:hypothetical protein
VGPAPAWREADLYAARAVELWTRPRDDGCFKETATVEYLEKESDLDALRSRDDFKKLVADLEKTATPRERK